MLQTINPNMILLAREARSLTQTDLAQKLQTYKANISRLEHGSTEADPQTLAALATATNFPQHFFLQQGQAIPLNLSYRKRKKVPAKLITPIQAHANIIRLHAQFVTRLLQHPTPKLPLYKVDDDKYTPQKIAALVRKKWNIPAGPIQNLITILEQQQIIISVINFGTNRVDSCCMLTDDNYPIIFLNKNLLGDRQRFSLAFELGHLLMHTFGILPHDVDINHQANVFAAEFLMPQIQIKKQLTGNITLPFLAELKRIWKVSMIALLYRADDLGVLTPNQKRYLIQQFNDQKIRRREPPELDVPIENPKLMRQLLAKLIKTNKLQLHQVHTLLAIHADDYINYYA